MKNLNPVFIDKVASKINKINMTISKNSSIEYKYVYHNLIEVISGFFRHCFRVFDDDGGFKRLYIGLYKTIASLKPRSYRWVEPKSL